jgi:hypothetical protein
MFSDDSRKLGSILFVCYDGLTRAERTYYLTRHVVHVWARKFSMISESFAAFYAHRRYQLLTFGHLTQQSLQLFP